jgi:hypothetical protein
MVVSRNMKTPEQAESRRIIIAMNLWHQNEHYEPIEFFV